MKGSSVIDATLAQTISRSPAKSRLQNVFLPDCAKVAIQKPRYIWPLHERQNKNNYAPRTVFFRQSRQWPPFGVHSILCRQTLEIAALHIKIWYFDRDGHRGQNTSNHSCNMQDSRAPLEILVIDDDDDDPRSGTFEQQKCTLTSFHL